MTAWIDSAPWSVPGATVYRLEHGGRPWRISVAEPLGPRDEGARRRVVYVLDPFGTFGTTVHVARITEVLGAGAFPGLLVVGVGPDSEDFAELHVRRHLDLSPVAATAAGTEGIATGGGDAFLDLLVDVVAPYVEAHHGGDPADRTLAGWSLGALLGTQALLTRPRDFRRYLLVSPSLWWADAEILGRVERLTGCDAELAVYVAVGEREETTAERAWPPMPQMPQADYTEHMRAAGMVTRSRQLVEALRALHLPAMTVSFDVLGGEHHNTIWAAAVSRGLLALHATSYTVDG